MDARSLRDVFGRFATGVTVVTCLTDDGTPHGATVTAFTPISLDPPLVQVALTRASKACQQLDGAAYAVNVLAADQVGVAMHFAGRPGPDPIRWRDAALVPVLEGAAATFSCRAYRTDDGGDHLLFLGEVVEAEVNDRDPLLFHASAFHHLGSKDADATWLGCADDPHTGWFDASTDFTSFAGLTRVPAATHY